MRESKKGTNEEMLNWTAWFVLWTTAAAIALTIGWNWKFLIDNALVTAIVFSPLLIAIPLLLVIEWAIKRVWKLCKEEDSEPVLGKTAKGVVMVAVSLLLFVSPAKAIDDDLMGGYAGIYTRAVGPAIFRIYTNALNQFIWAWRGGERGNYDGR